MRHLGKTTGPILVYSVLLIILLAATHWASYNATYMCWDGLEVDEALLMELCGVTEQAYWEMDPADCPQSIEAIEMIGGCEPDYATVVSSMVVVGALYSLIFLGIVWVRRRRAGG